MSKNNQGLGQNTSRDKKLRKNKQSQMQSLAYHNVSWRHILQILHCIMSSSYISYIVPRPIVGLNVKALVVSGIVGPGPVTNKFAMLFQGGFVTKSHLHNFQKLQVIHLKQLYHRLYEKFGRTLQLKI